ncbi:MAG: ribonuclease P protein component [Patescibacteria group bacterium]
MLPKKNRVNKKEVDFLFKKGRSVAFPDLTFKFFMARGSESLKFLSPRVSVIVPKAIAKLAVKRNLLRRLGYSILEKHIKEFPASLLGVFIFKKYQDDVLTLEHEIKNILDKIN